MKKNEEISIKRTFILIFAILTTLTMFSYYYNYINIKKNNEQVLLKEMAINIFKPNIKKFKIELETNNGQETNIIKNTKTTRYAYFVSPYDRKKIIKISINKDIYAKELNKKINSLNIDYILIIIGNASFALIITAFLLLPLIKNVKTTDEFIKDILHDINTPLTTIKINILLLTKSMESNNKKQQEESIERIQKSIEKLIFLQKNLKSYQEESINEIEELNINDILNDKISYYKNIYQDINFELKENIKNKNK